MKGGICFPSRPDSKDLENRQRKIWRALGCGGAEVRLTEFNESSAVVSKVPCRTAFNSFQRKISCNNIERSATARADESELPGDSVYCPSVKILVAATSFTIRSPHLASSTLHINDCGQRWRTVNWHQNLRPSSEWYSTSSSMNRIRADFIPRVALLLLSVPVL